MSGDSHYPTEAVTSPRPAVLEELARASGRPALLWRGLDAGSGDLDVLVPDEVLAAAEAALLGASLQPEPAGDGRTILRDSSASRLDIDVLA